MNLFDFWYNEMILVVTMWRGKVLFNLVRPTTVVHALKHGQTVSTFAGFFAGVDNVKIGNPTSEQCHTRNIHRDLLASALRLLKRCKP